ncbi:hypothetical protein [Bombella sp. ESL0385]|uniref:hypothetical protein n=1 Tax=Bombella sp. ESL0385 TaxID=2676446 RepID=UPI0012D8E533|nr:hypothetical protein [Bombella sp. ESL0385]MUG90126.1 hypothetical protein [Bombella sp. ESL0385]
MRTLSWMRQPTTLYGLSLIIGGLAGAKTGALDANIAATLLMAALPLLLPDNSTARAIASSIIPTAVSELEKSSAANKEHSKPG